MLTKLVYYCWLFLQFIFYNRTMAKVSTACLGSPGVPCVEHELICTESLIISITNVTFGYRRGCSVAGIASCSNTTCCREKTGDCFTPYNQTLLSQLQQICSGRSTCTLNKNNGLDEKSSYCFLPRAAIFHSYSKIEYQCVTDTSLSTYPTSPATDSISSSTVTNDQDIRTRIQIQESTLDDKAMDIACTVLESNKGTIGIVGGVLGTSLVMSILINILLVLYVYRRRKTPKPESDVHQSEQQHYSTPSRGGEGPAIVDDSLNANEYPRSTTTSNGQIQRTNDSPRVTPANGEAHTEQNNQDCEHPYDSTAGRGTVAVYDSLNTREQTGYYNMGSINTTGT